MAGSQSGLTNPKYWIKENMSVAHKSNPYREMIVDRLLKHPHVYKDYNGVEHSKMWTTGVECHWIDDVGTYQTGRFLTTELKPFKKQ
jgi:hypothetical protein